MEYNFDLTDDDLKSLNKMDKRLETLDVIEKKGLEKNLSDKNNFEETPTYESYRVILDNKGCLNRLDI